MTAAPKVDEILTAEEYLALEEVSETKQECVFGAVYAMAGTSIAHNDIAGNIYGELRSQLRGKPCRPSFADVKLKVRVLGFENYYYPDVMIACDPTDNAGLWRERPTVVIEVLSPSSTRTDFDKFYVYQQISTLELYLIVAQDGMGVTAMQRTSSGWRRLYFNDPAAQLPLDSIGCQLSLAQIYEGIDFAAAK